jgi:Ca2+-transporting ATPase
LPEVQAPSLLLLFVRQFLNPLIYILLAAAVISLVLSDIQDAIFIGAVLLLNGIIGATQEHSAGRAAAALKRFEQPHATVIRDGAQREIVARDLVPGDVVLLEAGDKVPADARLLQAHDLLVDESLLTGESAPVKKAVAKEEISTRPLAERRDTAFAGTTIVRGRAVGEVNATGGRAEIGKIAEQIRNPSVSRPPLLIRIERFTRNIAIAVGLSVVMLLLVGLSRQMSAYELFMMSVGLAVSAIPEGLPVAISIALAVAMRRMAAVHVIVRNMPAVEALGSCTMIASDKTGTLTMNELTVTHIALPDGTALACGPGDPFCAEGMTAEEPLARAPAVV